ncbi:conserved membrane hypothetical protein [Tenacibaculum maritimum]|uniref:hypothetical protein n=1 Tax=Tenacibaculum maritimum TaxID=107401 RepID=UPI0012E4A1D4|nr:hypothetical protein [Tenacibaculum maritimum]CAA0253669.1 conserved membrane hypothetical protein [Tenacibaculum maritimum]
MKKLVKIVGILLLLLIVIGAIFYTRNNDDLPKGKQGAKADKLAHKMLNALNYEAYKNTRFLEWSFREKRFYKWDKKEHVVTVSWENTKVILNTKEPNKTKIFENGALVKNEAVLKKATDYFNNDSFWLVAPYKVFENGIERRLVNYQNKEALLVTYTSGGSTPGDSYLWILNEKGLPISYKMWVSIIPIGGTEASWSDWVTTQSGALLPTKHELSVGTLDLGEVKGYN